MNIPSLSIDPSDYNAWDDDLALNLPESNVLEYIVEDEYNAQRIDVVLAAIFVEYSRSRLQKWVKDHAVTCNAEVVTSTRLTVYEGDLIQVTPQMTDEMKAYTGEEVPFEKVYEDDDILIINKHAGLVVHPGAGNWSRTLLNGLLHEYPDITMVPRAGIVHRLDKDTTGLMVVAKTAIAHTDLVRQLQDRDVKRRYLAIANGEMAADGTIEQPIGRHPKDRLKMAVLVGNSGKHARTHFQSMGFWEYQGLKYSIVVCQLDTGRTHQIRVHLQHIQHSLLGDPVYGERKGRNMKLRGPAGELDFNRQALHAYQLGLRHPGTGEWMSWQAPLPNDMVELLAAMGVDDFPLPDPDLVFDV